MSEDVHPALHILADHSSVFPKGETLVVLDILENECGLNNDTTPMITVDRQLDVIIAGLRKAVSQFRSLSMRSSSLLHLTSLSPSLYN